MDDPLASGLRAAAALPLCEVSFRVVDIEATGLEPFQNDVIEAAVSEVRAGKVRPIYQSLYASNQLSPRITELTGISVQMLEHAPRLADEFVRLSEALAGDCWVSHNAAHDGAYLTQLLWRFDPHLQPPPSLCTLKLSRRLLPPQKFSLRALAESLHLPLPAHRAASDVATTAALLAELIERAEALGAKTLADLLALQAAKPRTTPASKISALSIEALPPGPGLYRFFGQQDRLLYVGYSSEVRRRIREHLLYARSPELVAKAVRVEVDAMPTTLDAYIAEGRAIAEKTPALNVRNNERGRLRYFRLAPGGAITLVPASRADDARYFGPLVVQRSDRDVLRAARTCFGLFPRAQKEEPEGSARFVAFCTLPLGADGFSAPPPSLSLDEWSWLLDCKKQLWRAERERLDARRVFLHPTLVRGVEDPRIAYGVSLGRPTLRFTEPTTADVQRWLAASAAADERCPLDALGERVCAFVRAQPSRVILQSALQSDLQNANEFFPAAARA